MRWAPVVSLVCSLGATYTGSAGAHSLLDEPAPRDQRDGYKDGSPCGVGVDAAQPVTSYISGQTVNVKWLETVDHPGCFLVELSVGADQDFQILGRKSHSNPPPPEGATSGEPRHWNMDVTLPSTACSGCTLRLRQLMLDANVAGDACTPVGAPPGSIYTTCANITLDGGGSGGAAGSGGSAGAATSGSAGAATFVAPSADSSCRLGPKRGHSLVFATALALAMLRRRQRASAPRASQA
jgi:hypothetical protein